MNANRLWTCALVLAGCASEVETPAAPAPEVTHVDQWHPEGTNPRGPATLDPTHVSAAEGKVARRMSVDQLRRSIPALLGGITWTAGRNATPQFGALSRTLGEANYIQVNEDSLDPSPLFAKFMDDMAGDVCRKALARDAESGPNAEKLLVPSASDVDATLRFMRLKFHALHVPDGTQEGIAELRALYDTILSDTGEVGQAWLGVCVAVLTAPEMMIY